MIYFLINAERLLSIYQGKLLGTFKSDFKLLKCKPNGISGDIFQNLSNIIYNKHYFVMYLIERDR